VLPERGEPRIQTSRRSVWSSMRAIMAGRARRDRVGVGAAMSRGNPHGSAPWPHSIKALTAEQETSLVRENPTRAAVRRRSEAIRAAWPSGAPGYTLLGLLLAGAALRLIAIVSWWPAVTTLDDGYERFTSNPFENLLHPAGYSLIVGALGLVTREIAATILLQHLSGIAAGLLLWAATRRVTGSAWAGLLPAGIVLLDPDFIFLEHAIMSESWMVLAISIALYAAVRAFDDPDPWWRWPLLSGAGLAVVVTIRTAGLFMIPVVVLAILLCRSRSFRRWREWRGAVATAGAAVAILLAFATANATLGERFGLGASPGWYLYARAAQFADCSQFTPPPGTKLLCESRPASERPGVIYYIVDPKAPGPRYFGPFGEHDNLLGEWSKRAILAQRGDYLRTSWEYLRAYWVPGSQPERPESGEGLDPQLAFTNGFDDSGEYGPHETRFIERAFEHRLETFYNDFTVDQGRPGLEFLRSWQLVIRFGATALSITTVLTLLGLAIGTRRSRAGFLLFGVGGLALIVTPALIADYYGRYTVPMAGPLMAAAAITIVELWRLFSASGRE
jgi:4-amino-4-deoxy-L-arabinose transferase-like glycosyltransferase